MSEKTVSFLPFHAINEFMRDDYRLKIVHDVLLPTSEITDGHRKQLNKLTQRYVKLAGFRNASAAPASVRIKPTIAAFEKHPDMVAHILAAWADLHPELAEKIFQLLKDRNWEILPLDADRTVIPGFLPKWPKDEDFDILNAAYREQFADETTSSDDISLMIVWLSGRLPYEKEGEEEEHPEAE